MKTFLKLSRLILFVSKIILLINEKEMKKAKEKITFSMG